VTGTRAWNPGRHFPGYLSFAETPQQDEVDVRRLGETHPGNGVLDGELSKSNRKTPVTFSSNRGVLHI